MDMSHTSANPAPDPSGSAPAGSSRRYGSSSRKSAAEIHPQPDGLLLVSRRTREMWLQHYPSLRASEPLRRFVAHVLVRTSTDAETGLTSISDAALRGCGWNGAWPRLRRLIVQAGFHIQTTAPASGRCRCVKRFDCARDLLEAVLRDLAETPIEDLVSFATGLPPRSCVAACAEPVPEVLPLIERLHAQPADAYAQAAHEADRLRRRHGVILAQKPEALAQLARFAADPAPRYHSVAASPRLCTSHPAQNLPRGMRAEVLKRCHHVQIDSSRLHIAAWLWNCPLLKARLESSIWPYLLEASGVSRGDEPLVETAVYSIIDGADRWTVRRGLVRELGSAAADAFLGLPEIRELLDRRDGRLEAIRNGVVLDAFARELDASAWPKPGDAASKARSVLEYQMQTYELALMLAVAEALEDVPIVAWLHDGLYYACDTAAARELALRADAAAAAKGLELLGSPAILEHWFAELRGCARKTARGTLGPLAAGGSMAESSGPLWSRP